MFLYRLTLPSALWRNSPANLITRVDPELVTDMHICTARVYLPLLFYRNFLIRFLKPTLFATFERKGKSRKNLQNHAKIMQNHAKTPCLALHIYVTFYLTCLPICAFTFLKSKATTYTVGLNIEKLLSTCAYFNNLGLPLSLFDDDLL